MMVLISALDALERRRTGNQAARIQRLDISAAELVLTLATAKRPRVAWRLQTLLTGSAFKRAPQEQ